MAASHHDATLNTDPYTTSLDSTPGPRSAALSSAVPVASSTPTGGEMTHPSVSLGYGRSNVERLVGLAREGLRHVAGLALR